MSTGKFEPPTDWIIPVNRHPTYSVEDFVDTPYPHPTAVLPVGAGKRAGALADWQFQSVAGDSRKNAFDVRARWNDSLIVVGWRIHRYVAGGHVWIGVGTVSDQTTERWFEADIARPGWQTWDLDVMELPFVPTKHPWWLEIVLNPPARRDRST
ncbi:MAG: hypothetical protein EPO40_05730 [Myxococcaceae bacterium]|nr:MAG: hypothetical protein EPO40_05730 [Myxococcaceae bacterium]